MKPTEPDSNSSDSPIFDAEQFAADAERYTNNVMVDEWLSIYNSDAVVEWVTDGAIERLSGIDEIRRSALVMATIWRRHQLRVRKTVECVGENTLVLSFHGSFRDGRALAGNEIWTFDGPGVSRHHMCTFLDVRSTTSPKAFARVLLNSPSIAISYARQELPHLLRRAIG